jgi:hypothetical protein
MWWNRVMKRKIRQIFSSIGAQRKGERETTANFYYSAVYDLLGQPEKGSEEALLLKNYRKKVVRLNSIQNRAVMMDNNEYDK